MNSRDIIIKLYDLINDGIKIWAQGENIKVFIPEGITFSEEQKEFIALHKNKILDCLHRSRVYSEDYNYVIFKGDSNSSALSFAQERLWFIEEYEQGTNAYNIPMVFKLVKDTKLTLLEKSINNILARHEVLRTLIKADNRGIPHQSVLDNTQCSFEVMRVTGQTQLMQELGKQANHIYDLSRECPIRVCLYELTVNSCPEYYLSIVIHHIAFDGWSIDVFLEELQSCYRYYSDLEQGLTPTLNLPTLGIQYKDFALWQHSYLSGNRLEGQLKYWKDKLAECEILSLPTDKLRPSQIDYKGRDKYFHLDKDVSEGLRAIAKELKISLYSVLLSGYYLMLRAYSNQDDVIVGTPVANRHYNQVENLIGLFVNTLALRTKIESNDLIKDFIEKVGKEVIEAQSYQDLPFEKLVDELKITRDPGRNPIFQVMFGVQKLNTNLLGCDNSNNILQEYKEGLELYNAARFDISTFVDDSQLELRGVFNYMLSLYTDETISRFIETYTQILKQFATLAHDSSKLRQTKIKDLSYLSSEQYHQVVTIWNQTAREYPKDKTINQLFEEQVGRTPDNIAVVYEELKLTYKELNERANGLAHYLRQNYDIKPDTLVALCLDRSEHMLIAILAVLKAGGAYVPMDPGYPDERIEYILKDTSTKVVLTNEVYKGRLEEISTAASIRTRSVGILAIDSQDLQKTLTTQHLANPVTDTGSNNLVYVIYTSGTTGNPKGVMIEHKGIVSRIKWMNDTYPLNEKDRILQKTPYVFDVSVWELLWPNWYGATVVFAKAEGHKDANYLTQLINKEAVSVVHFVPSMLEVFQQALRVNGSVLPSLRRIFCSGEALTLAQVKKCNQLLPHVEVHNLYGPTEASVDVLYYDCNTNVKQVYIGKPIDNSVVYVLDPNLAPLPIGAIGELHIGGAGLARGYLNKADLTAERFIENPFQTEEEKADKSDSPNGRNARLYKTGDLVRWLPDGNIEYIGRGDFQVKIRGYRIELGEVENALSSCEGVRQSVVLAREHHQAEGESAAGKYLVGYYVADNKLDEAEILGYLQSKLPEYMVPSALVYLEKLPLTINGKLDRNALPEHEFTSGEAYAPPRNELEGAVCQIWSEVLGLPEGKVGIKDDFFRLGGDSIVSIQLVSRIRQRLGLDLSIKDIFNYKTIEKLYDNVLSKNLTDKVQIKSEQGILSGEVGLLPIQTWFFENDFVKASHWNQSFLIRVPELDLGKLNTCLEQLVAHHDALRLKYVKDQNNQYVQYYDDKAKVEALKILDLRSLEGSKGAELEEVLTLWQSSFNTRKGPVYRIGYIYGYEDGSSRIFFALHHLIVDAVSWRILLEDLRDLYEGKQLGSKVSSYRQWVGAVKEYANSHSDEGGYWADVLDNYDYNIQFGKLEVNENIQNYTSLELTEQQTQKLLKESNKAYNTQINDLLLTALGYAVSELTGSNVNHIILEGHGREEIDSNIDITRTVGWFTSMYPVRLKVREELGSSIKYVKEALRRIPNKGIGYGALFGYQLKALPRISFNYLGQFGHGQDGIDSVWNITGESSGTQVSRLNYDPNVLNINGLVIDRKLKFSIASKLNNKVTEKLTSLFKDKLNEIINYTTSQTRIYLTVSDIDNVISQDYLDKLQENREIEGVYLAGSLQQGFIYHALNQGDIDDAYRVQLIWQYNSNLVPAKLKQAWEYAQSKYGALRLRFAWEEELVQIIDKKSRIDWRYIDLSDEINEKLLNAKIIDIQERDREEIYRLEEGDLFRIYLIKQREDLYSCIFSSHHAILDGWSNPILLGYVHETYLRLCDKEPVILSVDKAYEETQEFLQKHTNDNKQYWITYLEQIEEKSDLSWLLANESRNIRINEYRHIKKPEELTLVIKDELYKGLKALSQKEGVTLNAIMQYVWHKTLSVYSQTNQTVVGTTISGRALPINNIEQSVGLFINTLPVIVNHHGKNEDKTPRSILEIIKNIQDDINETNNRSNIDLSKLQKEGRRLFDSIFIYENYPTPVNEEQQNRLKVNFTEGIEKLDYPLGAIAYDTDNILTFKLKYASEIFDADIIQNLSSMIEKLLRQITANPHRQEVDLNYLDEKRYKQIVYDWNATWKEYPKDKTIHQLFEEQVDRTPDNVAVVYEDTKLTYRQLNVRANQLANYIREVYDIRPDTLVALCLERSELMPIAILAVLKAGGAYVPMDPSYPDERIKYILEDTIATVVLTNEIYKGRLEEISATSLLAIDNQDLQETLTAQHSANPVTAAGSNNLAYVIYTSGTTGNPKGVMIEHRGVVSLVKNVDYVDINSDDTFIQFADIAFDAATFEIYGALLNGSRLYIPYSTKELISDFNLFYKILITQNVTILWLTKTLFDHLLLTDERIFKNLKYLLVGGEALNRDLIIKLLNSPNPPSKVINGYGPTENTTFSCTLDINQINISNTNTIPIGVPLTNRKAYILDPNLISLPIGAIGELYVGGEGLARGYLNRPDLTAERFIENPFQTEEGKNARLYKTGDLARWLPDGNIEYIGRNDFQVKIRGYRIELGEVENALASHEGVKQAAVLATEHKDVNKEAAGNKYLVGYYVADNRLDEVEILKYLQSKLPEYMVPRVLVHLEKLPLTINGKLDRKALPTPELTSSAGYMAPRNELEEQVCLIWAEVLGLPENKVGIRDDFFKMGGDSIVSIQLVSRMRQRLGLELSVKDIFSYKNIERLYDNVLSKNPAKGIKLKTEQGILSGRVDLLPVQQWFLASEFAKPNHWNQSFIVKTPDLNIAKLQASIDKLARHHDAFKLRFKKASSGAYEQHYATHAKVEEVRILDIRTIGAKEGSKEFNSILEETLTKWQSSFDTRKGPIYRIGYIYGYEDGSSRIFFALHHLIVDAVSWRILAEDLRDLYNGKELSSKGSSYRQWVGAVKEYGSGHDDERGYWASVLADCGRNKERVNKLVLSEDTKNHASLELSKQQTQRLLQQSNKAYNTQINDLLLTALGYALSEVTGNNVTHIVLEGHGREEIDNSIDVTRAVGWFTTMYPVRLEVDKDLGNSIKHVKETLRQIPNKGIGYGALIGYQNDVLPRISFNYLGQFSDNAQQGFWNITGEGSGTAVHTYNHDHHVININGQVVGERLQFHIASKLDEKLTSRLAERFKQKLEEVIDHTINQDRSYLTASDVDKIVSQNYLDRLQENREIEGVYLAGSLQQGFIYHALNQGDIDDAYLVQIIWEYKNQLNLDRLKESWELAQIKYPSLRLRFGWDEQLVQVIDKVGKLDWRYIDLSNEPDQEIRIRQIQEADRNERYSLEEGNLFRVYIIKQKNDLYTSIFSNHHAIIDGWSIPILLGYIHATYLKDQSETIDTSIDRAYLNTQEHLRKTLKDNEGYWEKYLSKIEERLNLNTLLLDTAKKNHNNYKYKHVINPQSKNLIIKNELYKKLKILSKEQGLTLNAILQYAWHKVLKLYGSNNSQNITTVVGTTVAGRNLPIDGMETSVGLYINTLPLIVEHDSVNYSTIIDSIRKLQDDITEINTKSNINLSKLQKDGERIFDILFVFENYPVPTKDDNALLKIEFKESVEKTDYPLAVIAYENEQTQELIFTINYAGELFVEQTIEQLLDTANTILTQVAEQIDEEPVKALTEKDLYYLTKDQQKLILTKWNKTDSPYPCDKTIHELFEEQVKRKPNNIAVVDVGKNSRCYKYSMLSAESNALARYIINPRLKNSYGSFNSGNGLIGVLSEKGYNQVVCALSIMRSGGCYLPLNVDWTVNKIADILHEGKVSTLLISQDQFKNKNLVDVLSKKYSLLVIEDILQEIRNVEYIEFLKTQDLILPKLDSNDVAYVIFTSGSTGTPKGVTITHKGAINTIDAINKEFNVNENDKILSLSEFSFDLSVYDIFGMLFTGGAIIFPDQSKIKDVSHWWDLINKHRISIWNTVPQLAGLLINEVNNYYRLPSPLRLFLLSGDYVPKQLPNAIMHHLKEAKVISLGGATEGSIWSVWYKIPSTNQEWEHVPYGFPMPNQKMYILNSYMQFCPVGAIGEIYIGGVGVASNYWNNQTRTAESFFEHPSLGKIYKTGDLGKWNKNGYIEYIGRVDFQVKIRGFRIELGEIESTLSAYPDIIQCIVIAKGQKTDNINKHLVAYYTTTSGEALEESLLVSYLSTYLPDYMIPSAFVYLEEFPLTINGKLDRKALPDPEFGNSADTYIPPRNELESKICTIFAEVLGIDVGKVGIRDDFFRMGGDSIISIQLVSKIRQRLGLEVNVKDIFSNRTIEKLIGCLENNVREAVVIGVSKAGKNLEQVLSFAQERLWFIGKYEEGTNAYNIPMVYRISEDTIIPVLIRSINNIIKRHEILRTFIKEDSKGHSYQLISDDPINIQEIEIEDKRHLDMKLSEDINYIYDLSNEYPIRIQIYKLNTNERYLSIIIHHIAFDGWSENIFLKELEEFYSYYNNQSKGIIHLSELTIQYKDFALWQRNYLTGEVLNKQLSYWKNKLADYETLNLITDKPRPLILDYEGKTIEFELDQGLSHDLRATAKHLGVSLYSLLLAGYYLMLRIYSNQDDIVIGTPIANRHYNQIEHLIGFFVNTLALRVTIDNPAITLKDFIKYVGDEVIGAQINQDLPFEKLVEELGVSKDISRHPIFQVLFTVQSFGGGFANKILEPYHYPDVNHNIAKFDLETSIDDSKDILKGVFNYRINLYNEDTIQRFIDTYKEILAQFGAILANSEIRIKDISFLTNEERKLLLNTWNNTDAPYPSHKTVHQIFEEQVERTPGNIAVVSNEVKLTYKELNEKASRLANYLIRYHNIKPDTLVTLFLDRSEHMVIAILAVLKAGGAYVPMDPSYPDERIEYIFKDTSTRLVLTNEVYRRRVEETSAARLILATDSKDLQEKLIAEHSTNPITDTKSNNLAYVMYTSGTTGNPKGVMIEHRSVVNLAIMQGKEFGLTTVDVNANPEVIKSCLCYANYIFDASVSEIFTAILTGHRIYILSDHERLNFNALDQYIRNNKIDVATIPPALLNSQSSSLNLNTLVVAGEEISSRVFYQYLQNNKKIINAYGPTETTVCSSLYSYEKNDTIISNIGYPLSNTKSYVLSPSLIPLPIKAVGELYIGGVGLARGYLNNPSLTNEQFVPNPFQTEEEKQDEAYGSDGRNFHLYKTGDLVRWLPDGNLEYIGRADFQVKIRGSRIELGEIESALSTYLNIKQCVVIAKEQKANAGSTNKHLVAYYTTVSGEALEESSLISYLSTRLPDYMIPSAFVYLEEFPLTINGKLDRRALPDPEFGNNADAYAAPRNALESKICTIFAEVLGLDVDRVGIRNDFFRMGGDSIVSIQLISRLRQRLNLNISVKDIFTYKSIERLYDNVVKKESSNNIKIEVKSEQNILSGELKLLPIQKWFFANNFKNPNHWNQSFIIKTPTLEMERLRSSIIKLIEHHDVFRMKYKNTEQGWRQYYDNQLPQEVIKKFDVSTLTKNEIEEVLTEAQSNFDIKQGPLYSISYLYGYDDGSARICFALHHLIVDTVSWRIILEDLNALYIGKNLGNKGSSYRQWVETVNNYAISEKAETEYWNNILVDYTSHDITVREDTTNSTSFKLSIEQTKKLLQGSSKAYNTQINDLLLTALGITLKEITKSRVNYIVLEGHGREDTDNSVDITRTMGWFTSMYPVRLEVDEELENSIKYVKESLRQVPNNGIGFGSIIGYDTHSLPKISFNYLGQLDQIKETIREDSWSIIDEQSGISIHKENRDNNIISINGAVISSQLEFIVESKLGDDVTRKLASTFKDKINEVINHVTSLARTYLTASDVGRIVSQGYLDKLQENREIEGVYLAGSLQQGFIYHALNQGDIDDAYRVQLIWEYSVPLDVGKLKEAWSYAQARFGSLRLRLAWEEELIQVIDKKGELDWRYIDLSNEPDQEIKIRQIQEADRSEAYKLEEGNLFRVYLIKQSNSLYTCIFSSHHAILDGWSNPILLGYIHEAYLKLVAREKVEVAVDYSYANAQQYLQDHKEDNKDYWDKYISQIEERMDLSGLLSGNKSVRINEYKHILKSAEEKFIIEGGLYEQLKKLGREEGVTLNAILQYAWHKILNIYGNSNQTVVGATVSGRNLPVDNIEHSVGLYINTLPLIVDHGNQASKSLIEAIREIQNNINEINSRSDISLARLQKGGERLFDSLFIYENYPSGRQEHKVKFKFKETIEKLDYPIGVVAYEANDQLVFVLKYAGELFAKENITNLLKTVRVVLEQIAANPGQSVQSLHYLSPEEYYQAVTIWNQTAREYPKNKTVSQLFEEQVERTPGNIAVVYEELKLTYGQLNEKANQLAHYIREAHDIKPDTLVALCLDRSEHMLIAILAVLKAGGAYVPMDPGYPNERIEYILEDTQATVILINEIHKGRLKELSGARLIALDSQDLQEKLTAGSSANPVTDTGSDNLAYVIYTSGTTGNPKGVMIEHMGVVNTLLSLDHVYNFNKGHKVTAFTSYVFDVSVSESFTSLIHGGELHLFSEKIRTDSEAISQYILYNDINYIYLPPILLSTLPKIKYRSLQGIIYAGEPCDEKTGKYWSNNYKLYNYYGPTEATIYATGKRVIDGDTNLIGIPIANAKAYILDPSLTPLPIGAIGELYIGGAGLARGYLNKADLTAERFIENPFQTKEEKTDKCDSPSGRNAKLYKTGDLVRWLPDGNIEYIGRGDFQVKIRGYRIELGEVENALSSYEGVKQAVVLAREHNPSEVESAAVKHLVGYYVADNKLDEAEILGYLQSKLPEYMVPSALVYLDKLPLTINGKLDRKALPEPEFTSGMGYMAPRNEIERQVCQIWSEVLGSPENKLGIRDDFFRMGGDSIVSIQLISRLRQRPKLGFISVKDIFSYRTIEKLYDNVIATNLKDSSSTIITSEQGILSGEVPLLAIQRWFFDNKFSVPSYWNQSFLIKTPKLNITALKAATSALIYHHDAFRLRYKNDSIQYYDDKAKAEELKMLDINTLSSREGYVGFKEELSAILASWQSNFNLREGPTYSIGYLFGFNDGSTRIFFAFHHLIIDTVSWRILTADLREIYYKAETDKCPEKLNLGSKGTSYRQWAEVANGYKDSHKDERSYWVNVLANIDASNKKLKSFIDRNTSSISLSTFALTKELTSSLLKESAKGYNTKINDLLLTALSLSLKEVLKTKVNYITLEGHGREENITKGNSRIDISRTMGWFTSMYPVRLEVCGITEDKDESAIIANTIKYTKETLRQVPNNGIGFGSIIGYDTNLLPRISFNYLGQLDQIKETASIDDIDSWSITDERLGISVHKENKDQNVISINGAVINGRLEFIIESKLVINLHKKLIDRFNNNLQHVINHSASKFSTEYTISDYTAFQPYVVYDKTTPPHSNNIFIMPPGEGGAESYFNNIVPSLSNTKLVLFNNFIRYLAEHDPNQTKYTTYETLAHNYIAYIKSIQTQGAYNLLGWSFGGVLAFEIVKQLIEQGDTVKSLTLIDSYFSFKTAISTNGWASEPENMNYKYSPLINNNKLKSWQNTNITLFKATEILSTDDHANQHYTNFTKHNYLDIVIGTKAFNTIEMPHSHTSWVYDKNQIDQINSVLLKNI